MITSIRGPLAEATPLRAVIELSGLSYEVNIPRHNRGAPTGRRSRGEAPYPCGLSGRLADPLRFFHDGRSRFFPHDDRSCEWSRPQSCFEYHEPAFPALTGKRDSRWRCHHRCQSVPGSVRKPLNVLVIELRNRVGSTTSSAAGDSVPTGGALVDRRWSDH